MSYIKVFTFGKAHGKVNNIEIMKTTQGNNINRKNKVEQVAGTISTIADAANLLGLPSGFPAVSPVTPVT